MSRKMKTFIIVCVVVFLLGLAAAITGMALHGWKDFYRITGNWNITTNAGDTKTLEMEGNAAKFNSMDVDMTLCQVEITRGNDYRVVLKYDSNMPQPEMKIHNGTLTVKSGDTLHFEGKDENFAMRLEVTVPKGATLKDGNLEVNLGQLKVSDVTIKNLNVSVDAGELTTQNLAFKKANFDLNFCSGDVGLVGSEADYSYKVDNEISTVTIDGREVGDMEKGMADGQTFGLSCDFSDVQIDFAPAL